jgi:hypothetical protein
VKQEKIKTLDFLLNKVRARHPDFDNIPKFSLFLGAGCSRTSGIPTGFEIINILKKLWFLDNFPKGNIYKKGQFDFNEQFFETNRDIFEQKTLEQELKLKEYILSKKDRYLRTIPQILRNGKNEDQLFQEHFDNILNDNLYGFWFNQFSESPRDRQQFIEHLIDKSEPKGAYLLLSHLIANEANLFSNIFTTNFDDLLNDSLVKYTDKKPRVYAHNEIAKYINVLSPRPNIIKLHGDFLFENIKNTTDETSSLWENMEVKLGEALNTLDIVVVGYNGADVSIMNALSKLKVKHNFGLYWCGRDYNKLNWRVKAFITEFDNSYFVPIESFEYLIFKFYESISESISQFDIVENSRNKQAEFDKYVSQFGEELKTTTDLDETELENLKESLEIILERNSFLNFGNIKDYQEKKEYLGKLRIDGISRVLKNIHTNISWEEAKFLYSEIDKDAFFLNKIKSAPIQHISNALSNLNVIDGIRTKAILESVPNEIISKKIQSASDRNVYSALGELGSICPEKIQEIKKTRAVKYDPSKFEKIELRSLIMKLKTASKESALAIIQSEESKIVEKLNSESVKEIAIFLDNLSEISEKLSRYLFSKVDDKTLKQKIEKENFNQIGISLNLFTRLDKSKTFNICESLDFDSIAQKTKELNLSSIQNGLREIHSSNNFLGYQLYNRLTNEFLKSKFEKADFQMVGEAPSNLIRINKQKTIDIIDLLADQYFNDLFSNSDYTYQQFATTIEKLTNINFKRFSKIIRNANKEKIALKILSTIKKTGEQVFIHFFPVLYNIDKTLMNLLIKNINSEYLYNLLHWDRLELYTVNLPSLKETLDFNKKTEESKYIDEIIKKNKYRFDKYRKQNFKKKHLP